MSTRSFKIEGSKLKTGEESISEVMSSGLLNMLSTVVLNLNSKVGNFRGLRKVGQNRYTFYFDFLEHEAKGKTYPCISIQKQGTKIVLYSNRNFNSVQVDGVIGDIRINLDVIGRSHEAVRHINNALAKLFESLESLPWNKEDEASMEV